jgi:Trypsin-co-occurring domain 2
MAETSEQGIGLADAIGMLRAEVLRAHAMAADSDVQFPVESMALELKVVATRSADGKAGFSIPFVNVELGGSAGWQRETTQTVTVTFGTPVDAEGNPVKVARANDELKG